MTTPQIGLGTVGLAMLLVLIIAAMLRVVWWALTDTSTTRQRMQALEARPISQALSQPYQVAAALGSLTKADVFTKAKAREDQRARLRLVAGRARGPAKLAQFQTPKGAA